MYKGTTRSDKFVPKHPEKYIGTKDVIVYRSSWELTTLKFMDNNPNVVRWSYEEIKIPYLKPLPHGGLVKTVYIPDVYVEYYNRNGELKKELLEIKPKKQTQMSRARKVERKMYENYIYAVNMAKWTAAETWCKSRGIEFRVITENSIFGYK